MAAGLALLALSLGACQDGRRRGGVPLARHLAPVPPKTLALMAQKGMSQSDPILIRAYKKEAEMEVWKRGTNGRYALLKTFPICRWSGQLGPKTKQGDRQAPEGFYTVTPGQMNPNSSYYLSFDTGYPNAYDRANGRTGNYIMVHGTCSSSGCFAMTDESMGEIYALARDSFAGGQRAFQFQSYPFRMTARTSPSSATTRNAPFWKNLKEGSDYFEALREEPRVGLCGTRYVFGGADVAAGSCTPQGRAPGGREARARQPRDRRTDRQGHARDPRGLRGRRPEPGVPRPQPPPAPAFASLGKPTEPELPYDPKEYARHHLGEVSRPETLAAGRARDRGRRQGPAGDAGRRRSADPHQGRRREPRHGRAPRRPPSPSRVVAEPAKPARVMVADADGDPAAYKKLLGNLFSNGAPRDPGRRCRDRPGRGCGRAGSPSRPSLRPSPRPRRRRTCLAQAKGGSRDDSQGGKPPEDKAAKPVAKTTPRRSPAPPRPRIEARNRRPSRPGQAAEAHRSQKIPPDVEAAAVRTGQGAASRRPPIDPYNSCAKLELLGCRIAVGPGSPSVLRQAQGTRRVRKQCPAKKGRPQLRRIAPPPSQP